MKKTILLSFIALVLCFAFMPYEHTYAQVPGQCNDGIDNDGDGLVDHEQDPGCSDVNDQWETGDGTPNRFGMPVVGGLIPCEGVYLDANGVYQRDCDFGDFMTLVQNLINFLVVVSIPIVVVLFAYAGFLYLTAAGNQSQISKGKSMMAAAAIGFIIVLSAWLIVKLIVGALLNDEFCNPLTGDNCPTGEESSNSI